MLDLARQLRRDMTLPEHLLWRELRGKRLGPRFRRQVPIGRYVVDFYCPAAKLVVEVDGEVHGDKIAADERRTAYLEGLGYRVVRFQATDVLNRLDDVVEQLVLETSAPSGPPGHLPRQAGEDALPSAVGGPGTPFSTG